MAMLLLQGACLVLIFATVYGLPSTLLEDVKHADLNTPRMNKVKRAQEVIMFGNQQNRAGDGRNNYARTDKRGDLEDSGTMEDSRAMDEIPAYTIPLIMRDNDLDVEPPRALPFRQNGYLYNQVSEPYFNDYRYLGQRRKRSSYPARNQMSRSARVFRSARSPSRAKRDLEIDPEDLFALLALWESERRNNPSQYQRELVNFPYDQHRKLDPEDVESNEISDGEDLRESGWLDGPIKLPSHKFISQEFYPDWTPALLHQAKQNKEGDHVKSLTELLENAPLREPDVPVRRRFLL